MKNVICTIAGATLAIMGFAQQFGFSGQGVLWMRRPHEVRVNPGSGGNRVIMTGIAPAVGIRLEGNYILPGYGFPVSGYNGIGVTWIAPSSDSAFYYAERSTGFGGPVSILGTEKTSILSIGIRFGYELPQDFNDFLLLHYGFGFGFTSFKSRYVLPEQSATFNYTMDDFKSETFEPRKARDFGIEFIVGAVYELEYVSIFGQYSLLLPVIGFNSNTSVGLRHGPSIGVFYPFDR